jgi:hypothetical protein
MRSLAKGFIGWQIGLSPEETQAINPKPMRRPRAERLGPPAGPSESSPTRVSPKPAPPSAKLGQTRSHPFVDEAEVHIATSEPWLSADDISTHLGVTEDTVYDA